MYSLGLLSDFSSGWGKKEISAPLCVKMSHLRKFGKCEEVWHLHKQSWDKCVTETITQA
jgi:hypothetical protein